MSISRTIHNAVRKRADNRCEYCLMSAACIYAKMNVDHIEPVTRGGTDTLDNLCFACPNCNNAKGILVTGFDPMSAQETPLFNPRIQIWADHFSWADDRATIIGLTACGRATVEALKMNQPESLGFRRLMVSIGLYPPD